MNQESLDYAVCKIMIRYADDTFKKYKTEEEKEDFVEIVLQYYDDTNIETAKYIRKHMMDDNATL